MANELVKIGLGDAMDRLLKMFHNFTRGVATEEDVREKDMILEALNTLELDLGFDCDGDGVPDVPAKRLFNEVVETSCCRISPKDTSRRSKDSSRRQADPSRKPSKK
jgi:hypothetical protein